MRNSDEEMRVLSEFTHDIIWDWDVRSNQVIHNEAFALKLGAAPTDYLALHEWWKARAYPGDVERLCQLYEEALTKGLSQLSYEFRIRDLTGQYLALDSRASFLRNAAGHLVRVLAAARDVTKRRWAEDAQQRLTRILEATTDCVGMANAEGQAIYLNAAGRKMLGLPIEGPLNLHLSALHPDWANEIVLKEAVPTAIREGYWRGETALLHQDGHEFPVSQVILSHLGEDGRVEFLSTIVRDLSDRKREEIARIEWANRYDAAIRASGQVLFDWNSFTHEMTYAGDIERLLGYTLAEMGGGLERFRALIEPEDLPGFDSVVARVISTRDPFHYTFRVRHKTKGTVFVEAKGYFFLDRSGQIGRMVGFFADITEQRRAQDELALAHNHLECRVTERTAELARVSAVIADRARQQEVVAALGQRALSGTPLDQLMDDALKLIRTILRGDCCSLLELTADGRELVVRAQSGWPDETSHNRLPAGRFSQSGYTILVGQPIIVEDIAAETRFASSQLVRDLGLRSSLSVLIEGEERPLGVLITFTREKRHFVQDDVHFVQAVANVLTAAIQRERAEESIRKAHEQSEQASRAKSEFLSRMSHELRTPLNAILGFTQLLELEAPTPSQVESIAHITRAGKHLLSMINEVLDIASFESGRMTLAPETIALAEFLEETLDLIRPLAARHGVSLILEASAAAPDHQVSADRQRFQQVILNLLSNAVKYNRPGGRVIVACHPDGPRLRITVTDTGLGIPPEKIGRLFMPFERLGAEATSVEGTGIGLTLARGIVAALHGELQVESRVGEGSTFSVVLPRVVEEASSRLAEAAPAFHPPAPIEPERPAHRTLLYIEDQDLNLRLVERILGTRSGYRLLTAMQGGLGFDLAREHQPDLILLDLNLPDMAGDQVLRRLKSDAAVRGIPVIMVSAEAMGERVEELLALGAAGYLTKPYRLTEFMGTIERVLASR